MSKERLKIMLNVYRNYEGDEDLDSMVAELRRNFLDYEVVNKKHNHDISNELVCGPEHVLYYLAEYIDILEQQNKRYREALDFYAEDDNYGYEVSYRPQPEIDCMVLDDRGYTARKALEEPK